MHQHRLPNQLHASIYRGNEIDKDKQIAELKAELDRKNKALDKAISLAEELMTYRVDENQRQEIAEEIEALKKGGE